MFDLVKNQIDLKYIKWRLYTHLASVVTIPLAIFYTDMQKEKSLLGGPLKKAQGAVKVIKKVTLTA